MSKLGKDLIGAIKEAKKKGFVTFDLADYVDHPVAMARINAGITQQTLAKHMKVTVAYIEKIEAQDTVTAMLLKKVKAAIESSKK